jgi:hypothetical protein
MEIRIRLINGKTIRRKRKGRILVRNEERPGNSWITCFYDETYPNSCEHDSKPFAECPTKTIKSFKGGIPIFAKVLK